MELTLDEALKKGVAAHKAGQIQEADRLYTTILKAQPNHPDANHNMGVLAVGVGKVKESLPFFKTALEANLSTGQFWLSYIDALMKLDWLADAQAVFDQAKAKGAIGEGFDQIEAKLNCDNEAGGLPELAQVIQEAILHREIGEFDTAVKLLINHLNEFSSNVELLSLLAHCYILNDDAENASTCLDKAKGLDPHTASVGWNDARLLLKNKNVVDALTVARKTIEQYPDDIEGMGVIGACLRASNEIDESLLYLDKAILLNPNYAEALINRGLIKLTQHDKSGALLDLETAHKLKPHAKQIWDLIVSLNVEFKQFDKAASLLIKMVEADPRNENRFAGLAFCNQSLGDLETAIDNYKKALKIKPDYAEVYVNMGSALMGRGDLEAALDSYKQAIKIKPNYAEAYNNMGIALESKGDQEAAIDSYKQALKIKPDFKDAFSNLLFTLNYHPDKSAEEIFAAYQEYDDHCGVPCRNDWRDHPNNRETLRRLKVGYVSQDFRKHSGRHFLEPLLAHHDKRVVEVYAYADLKREDEVTARYKSYVEHWIPTVGLSDAAVAERIRADGIDVLVDLAGHTANNRLGVFACKPAPVSISWLGYGYTTGLTAIDYFLTDAAAVPLGSEGLFSETPLRLETPACSFRPAEGMGSVSPLPAMMRGFVTFGTLTRSVRINHRTIRVWSEILKQVAGARLVIDSKSFQNEGEHAALIAQFFAHGINREQLELGFHSPPWDVLRGLDIGLDCFPHNSGTTLFETLYMGIPLVTLAGRPSVGRLGSSILEGVGHPEWIARTEAEYIKKAVDLANDLPALAHLRAGLRAKMEAGPLMDEAGFARKVEAAYQTMFAKWSVKKQ